MKIFFQLLLLFSATLLSAQKDTIQVFGPGGPFEPINEAAKLFCKKTGIPVKVTKGPFKDWKDNAKTNADIIYSGSEFMMTNFIKDLEIIREESVYPLYFRHSGLIVRKGNPKKIRTAQDLLKPGLKIMIVNGAGLTGFWEDIAGKMKRIDKTRTLRNNIVFFAENSGSAQKEWKQNKDLDVWISWNVWQKNNSESSDFVVLSERYTTYRDTGIALTRQGAAKADVKSFYQFLKGSEVKTIFKKWGWSE